MELSKWDEAEYEEGSIDFACAEIIESRATLYVENM